MSRRSNTRRPMAWPQAWCCFRSSCCSGGPWPAAGSRRRCRDGSGRRIGADHRAVATGVPRLHAGCRSALARARRDGLVRPLGLRQDQLPARGGRTRARAAGPRAGQWRHLAGRRAAHLARHAPARPGLCVPGGQPVRASERARQHCLWVAAHRPGPAPGGAGAGRGGAGHRPADGAPPAGAVGRRGPPPPPAPPPPRVLWWAEPLAALDAPRKAELLPYLERLQRGLDIPVLYVSHALDEVARLAGHLVLLQAGRVLAQGRTEELLVRLDLPLAHGDAAATVIEGRVLRHDAQDHIATVAFAGGQLLLVSPAARAAGAPIRLRVQARDVSLALAAARESSILNILPATVVALAQDSPGQHMVALDVGPTRLLARVTQRSAQALALAPGQSVFAQIKGIAVID